MTETLDKSCNYDYMTSDKRLNERELEMCKDRGDGYTLSLKRSLEREKDFAYNIKHFGNRALGIHKKELPKFQLHSKKYWKHLPGYMKRRKPLSLDEQRTERVSLKSKTPDITEKPTLVYPFKNKKGYLIDDTVAFRPVKRTLYCKPPEAKVEEPTVKLRPISKSSLHSEPEIQQFSIRTGGFNQN